jgi:hypothetical protein
MSHRPTKPGYTKMLFKNNENAQKTRLGILYMCFPNAKTSKEKKKSKFWRC